MKLKNIISSYITILIIVVSVGWHYGQHRYRAGLNAGVLLMYVEVMKDVGYKYYIKYESGDPNGIIKGVVGSICEDHETHEKWIMTSGGFWELIK